MQTIQSNICQELGVKPTIDPATEVKHPSQADESELGLTYEQIDDYLEGKTVPAEVAKQIEQRFSMTRHKRAAPVTPSDSWWKISA